jgi:hypothetical protein
MFDDASLSRERTIFICYRFFKQIRDRFGRKPVLPDGVLYGTIQPADGLD